MMRVGEPKLGFRTRLRRGWNITKLGIHVVRADPELMVYTLLSGLFSIGAAIGLLAVTGGMGFFVSGEEGVESGMLLGMFLRNVPGIFKSAPRSFTTVVLTGSVSHLGSSSQCLVLFFQA